MSHYILFEQGAVGPDILTITGNTGGAVGPDALGNINFLGSGALTITGTPGSYLLTASITGGGLVWETITAATKTLEVNHGYFASRSGAQVTFTLPSTASVGDIIRIVGIGDIGFYSSWRILQDNINQQIRLGNGAASGRIITLSGVTHGIAATKNQDCVELVCCYSSAPTVQFEVISAIGTINTI